MTGEGTVDRPQYVPAAELTQLVDDLTVADIRKAREAFRTEGDPMRGFAAVYYAAERLGRTEGADLDSYLARVRIVDLTPLLARANATLPEGPSGTSSSLPSAASGE